MKRAITIALDCMGGDGAPANEIAGAAIARERYPHVRFLLYGRAEAIEPLLRRDPALAAASEVRATDGVVAMDAKPSQVVRRGRETSMGRAIAAVADGEADVAVSAGNTGALMGLAKLMLKTMPGIDRPALATLIPTYAGESAMLDLGANAECGENNLVEFAIMGAAFARTTLGLERPSVALLNIGSEEMKGTDTLRLAAERLKNADLPLAFAGFVEGDKIPFGTVDVVVTDGFTGNVALKTLEGTARFIAELIGDAFRSSPMAKLGYLLARRGIQQLRSHLDPNRHNGAVMLGLNGLVVKSHGSANAEGIATAIGVAADMARHELVKLIAADLEAMQAAPVAAGREGI